MSKPIYHFKETGIKFNVDAQVAGEEIERIKLANGNQVKPDNIIAEAKNPDNPLHNCFDWDDAIAANKHRLQIARVLIGSIVVTFQGYESIRCNYSVKIGDVSSEKQERTYVGVREAVNNPDFEEQFKSEALNLLKSFIKRYQIFPYLKHEVDLVSNIVETLSTKIESNEHQKVK